MDIVTIARFEDTGHGSRGRAYINNRFFCYCIEPPWRDNLPNHSCIPIGSYHCVWHQSSRYGWVYLITDVPDRAHVLIHPGNYGGDTELGYKTHTKGCVLLGSRLGVLSGQRSVLVSRPTVRRFFDLMGERDFILSIH